MKIEAIHHVSLGVTDLERSRQFYREILKLEEIARPPFGFPGAWFSARRRRIKCNPACLAGPRAMG